MYGWRALAAQRWKNANAGEVGAPNPWARFGEREIANFVKKFFPRAVLGVDLCGELGLAHVCGVAW
jgi:hypothetical protein